MTDAKTRRWMRGVACYFWFQLIWFVPLLPAPNPSYAPWALFQAWIGVATEILILPAGLLLLATRLRTEGVGVRPDFAFFLAYPGAFLRAYLGAVLVFSITLPWLISVVLRRFGGAWDPDSINWWFGSGRATTLLGTLGILALFFARLWFLHRSIHPGTATVWGDEARISGAPESRFEWLGAVGLLIWPLPLYLPGVESAKAAETHSLLAACVLILEGCSAPLCWRLASSRSSNADRFPASWPRAWVVVSIACMLAGAAFELLLRAGVGLSSSTALPSHFRRLFDQTYAIDWRVLAIVAAWWTARVVLTVFALRRSPT